METVEAEKILDRMIVKTTGQGIDGIGLFIEEFHELSNACYVIYGKSLNLSTDNICPQLFNGVRLIVQELTDIPMNGRI